MHFGKIHLAIGRIHLAILANTTQLAPCAMIEKIPPCRNTFCFLENKFAMCGNMYFVLRVRINGGKHFFAIVQIRFAILANSSWRPDAYRFVVRTEVAIGHVTVFYILLFQTER